jgi:hypothetical protein
MRTIRPLASPSTMKSITAFLIGPLQRRLRRCRRALDLLRNAGNNQRDAWASSQQNRDLPKYLWAHSSSFSKES